jgi:UDP-N-acetylglucosamine 2-epimerase (non-hydrolysing)/GDP/UDP-N,N'-diacetylbacillosamine 2-epimerase (hydrolysing)
MRRLADDGVQVLMTYPNNDAGGRAIIAALDAAMDGAPETLQLHRSLGRYNYHGVLALARDPDARVACVGNSSSGIKETPAFGCPTVNIGARQQGRLRAENVVDAPYEAEAIYDAVRQCLFDDDFRAACARCANPYGEGDAGKKIADVLATVPLDKTLIQKKMTLLGEEKDGWFR